MALLRWRDFHRVNPVNLSVWNETRLKHRWEHRLNFLKFYPPIVEGKHQWTTGGSPVKAQHDRLSRWNTVRNARLNVKGYVLFPVIHTFFSLVSACSLPLQVGRWKHKFTRSILASMKRIFPGGSPFISTVVYHWKQRERGIRCLGPWRRKNMKTHEVIYDGPGTCYATLLPLSLLFFSHSLGHFPQGIGFLLNGWVCHSRQCYENYLCKMCVVCFRCLIRIQHE